MSSRFTIAQLMALTGVVAVNLAVVEASTHIWDLIIAVYLCEPILIAVQLALYRSVFGRPARRWFWRGFAVSGAAAAVALYLAYFHMPFHLELMRAYTYFWDAIARIAPGLERLVSSHEWSIDAAFAIYYFVPQVLVAFVGGVLAARLARGSSRGSDVAVASPGLSPNRSMASEVK